MVAQRYQPRRAKSEADRRCLFCGTEIWAAPMATAVWCTGCRRQVNVENYTLRHDADVGELQTAGTITIHRDAHIQGTLRAGHIHIFGSAWGHLAAYECVVESTGKVAGMIVCERLCIEPGAVVDAEIEQATISS